MKVDNLGKVDSHYNCVPTVAFCSETTYRIVLAHILHRILWPHQFQWRAVGESIMDSLMSWYENDSFNVLLIFFNDNHMGLLL